MSETSVPLRAKGQATFKTPEDQNLLSGKQDADPYALFAHVGWSSVAAIADCWTCHHHWLVVGKTFLTGSWWKVEKWLEGPGKEEKMRKQAKVMKVIVTHPAPDRMEPFVNLLAELQKIAATDAVVVSLAPLESPGIPYCWFFSDKKEGK